MKYFTFSVVVPPLEGRYDKATPVPCLNPSTVLQEWMLGVGIGCWGQEADAGWRQEVDSGIKETLTRKDEAHSDVLDDLVVGKRLYRKRPSKTACTFLTSNPTECAWS